MTDSDRPPTRVGAQGWKQFLTSKRAILDAFDRGREHARSHEVETHHGRVAESQFREWLSDFLPKRFGVTAGYIVSQGARDDQSTPHFDVIVYDQLAAPVLWLESHPDVSDTGTARAIPAEYVQAVMEVKSSMDGETAKRAMEHLEELQPLLKEVDCSDERYPRCLPVNFFAFVVFVELRRAHEYSRVALDALASSHLARGYSGAVVLRGEGLPPDSTARVQPLRSKDPISGTVGRDKESLLTGSPLAESREASSGTFLSAMLTWSEANFSMFAFDVVALLNDTYRPGYASSGHAMNWLNPERDRTSGP